MALLPSALTELPEQLKGYKLLERLGRGGFGEVWKVEAPGGFQKAMKFVFGNLDQIDEDGQPAEQELKALHRVKSIRHPYILSLERFDIIEGQLIIVMELADRNLWDRFRECRLAGLTGIPRQELMGYLTEAAEALDLMNNHYQVQHLDIKPQNLFLVFDHIKVADFGLAKAFEGARATVTGGVTPVYAAPETFEGYVSRYSDQYSLAIVFQELLTGCRPFNGANTKQLLLQHLRDAPDLSSLPAADRPIIGRALSKTPNERWPTCMDLLKNLANSANPVVTSIDTAALPIPAKGGGSQDFPPKVVQLPSIATMPASALDRARSEVGTTVVGQSKYAPGVGRTPMPNLVTPKLVTPRSAGVALAAPALTLSRREIVETGRMGQLGIAPPPQTGEGVLFPAVVVGAGQLGLQVLQQLRRLLGGRFGKASAIPSLQFLYLDTDSEAIEAATQGEYGLHPNEVFHAKLNRPTHYLQQEGLPSVDQWIPQGLLYQLPKTPTNTQGIRAFGRLALCGNYRSVVQKIRSSVEAMVNGDPLGQATKETGLKLRTNQPRVYVVCGTAGGTGSGMFLDLAYLFKHELRQVGYRDPEAVAFLLAPSLDKRTPRIALANSFAAFAEVYHFSSGQQFQTRYDTTEAAVTESRPPFERTAILELPRTQKPVEVNRLIGSAARALYLDLLSPIGRTSDYVRSVAPVDKFSGPVVQPFGLFRLSWPRPELLASITRRFVVQVIRRWTDKETTHLREPIQQWLGDQWQRLELDRSRLLARLTAGVTEQLRETPEAVFEAAVEALRTNTPVAGKLGAQAAATSLDQMLKLIGKPTVEMGEPGTLTALIETSARQLLNLAEAQLATVAVSFIEQPQYRLAGAEESLTQITDRLNEAIEQLDHERKHLAREETELYARMFPLICGLGATGFSALGSRKSTLTAELFDLLAQYPKKRYQHLCIAAALTVYRGLLDCVPECLREVNQCRAFLDQLQKTLEAEFAANPDSEYGAFVLPIGCTDLDAAADQFLAALPPEDLLEFDQQIQAVIEVKMKGLASVCTKAKRGERLLSLMRSTAREFLDERLEHADPSTALARYRGTGAECQEVLASAYDQAKPTVTIAGHPPPMEATLLAAPSGASGDLFRQLVSEANPGIEFIPAELSEDLVFFREYPRLPMADLPQLSPSAREAYHAQAGTGHSPHSRSDLQWLAPVRTGHSS